MNRLSAIILALSLAAPIFSAHSFSADNSSDPVLAYIDFERESSELGEYRQNPHAQVLETEEWFSFVGFLLTEYLIDQQHTEVEAFDLVFNSGGDFKWLDFAALDSWLAEHWPEVSFEVLGSLIEEQPLEFLEQANERKIVGSLVDTLAGNSTVDTAQSPEINNPSDSETGPDHQSKYAKRLCPDQASNFPGGVMVHKDVHLYQELMYHLWWSDKGCMNPAHFDDYLAFRQLMRTHFHFLKTANGGWNTDLDAYTYELGMFDPSQYTLDHPTFGDLIEYQIFAGWIQYRTGGMPAYETFESELKATEQFSFTYPVLVRPYDSNNTAYQFGAPLMMMMAFPEDIFPVKALELLTSLREAPISQYENLYSWLNRGDKPLTELELHKAGTLRTLSDYANYTDAVVVDWAERVGPDSPVLAFSAELVAGLNRQFLRAPDDLVNRTKNFGDNIGHAIYGMEGHDFIERLNTGAKDFITISELAGLVTGRRPAVKPGAGAVKTPVAPTKTTATPRAPPAKLTGGTATPSNSLPAGIKPPLTGPGEPQNPWNAFLKANKGHFKNPSEAAKEWQKYKQIHNVRITKNPSAIRPGSPSTGPPNARPLSVNGSHPNSIERSGPEWWKKTKWTPKQVNGHKVYQRDDLFNPKQMTSWKVNGKVITGSNIERMKTGRAPIGKDGRPVNLHHTIQSDNGPITEIGAKYHQSNYKVLHSNTGQSPSSIDRNAFNTWRRNYWKTRVIDF